jgi:hypothetical protein
MVALLPIRITSEADKGIVYNYRNKYELDPINDRRSIVGHRKKIFFEASSYFQT